MTSEKFYRLAALGMLILNLGLLATLLFPLLQSGPPQGKVKEHFGLTESQYEQFKSISERHHSRIEALQTAQHQILSRYLGQLSGDATHQPMPLDSNFFELEEQRILELYAHFQELKGLLNNNQLEAFPSFVDGVLNRMDQSRPRKRPRPKRPSKDLSLN